MALSKNHELGTFASGLDVNQATGAVTSINIDTDAVSEGSSNQYYTNERVALKKTRISRETNKGNKKVLQIK